MMRKEWMGVLDVGRPEACVKRERRRSLLGNLAPHLSLIYTPRPISALSSFHAVGDNATYGSSCRAVGAE
jgi:hypothetical protein